MAKPETNYQKLTSELSEKMDREYSGLLGNFSEEKIKLTILGMVLNINKTLEEINQKLEKFDD